MPLTKIQSLGITDGTIVNADINASAAIAGTKLSNLNDAKAWVNFNGQGTVAIRGSFNVSSITDNATGRFSVNLTNALTDTNYAIIVNSGLTGSSGDSGRTLATGNVVSSSVCAINTKNSSTSTLEDYELNCVALFR